MLSSTPLVASPKINIQTLDIKSLSFQCYHSAPALWHSLLPETFSPFHFLFFLSLIYLPLNCLSISPTKNTSFPQFIFSIASIHQLHSTRAISLFSDVHSGFLTLQQCLSSLKRRLFTMAILFTRISLKPSALVPTITGSLLVV